MSIWDKIFPKPPKPPKPAKPASADEKESN